MAALTESQSSTGAPYSTESEYVSTSYTSFSTSSASPTDSSTVATTTVATTSESTTAAASLTPYTSKSISVMPSSTASTTSVANSTSSIQSSQQHTSGSKISTGALAGAIVGAFAGGCILALLVAFLCLRGRKRSPHPTPMEDSSVFVSSIIPKSPRQTARNVPKSSVSVTNGTPGYMETSASNTVPLDLSPFVAEAADDSAVCTRIQTFFDQVSLHVDNYYSRPGLQRQLTSDMVARINGYDSSLLGTTLATLLSNSRSQRPILTHTLLYAILLAIQPKSQEPSLIPACYRLRAKSDLFNAAGTALSFLAPSSVNLLTLSYL